MTRTTVCHHLLVLPEHTLTPTRLLDPGRVSIEFPFWNRCGPQSSLRRAPPEKHVNGFVPIAPGDKQLTRIRYLMVDIVVNNVVATSTNPDYSKFMFKDKVGDPRPPFPLLPC